MYLSFVIEVTNITEANNKVQVLYNRDLSFCKINKTKPYDITRAIKLIL